MELWNRLPDETEQAHEAFRAYLHLPSGERSVTRTYRTKNHNASKASDSWRRWATAFAWTDRARAYDGHLERIRRKGMEEAIEEEARAQAKAAEQRHYRMEHLLTMAYDHAISAMEDLDFSKALRPQDIAQIVRLHIEATDKLTPAETDTEGSSVADWTEEDDFEFDRILAEIVAEEQRNPETHSDEDKHPEESEDGQPRQG